MSDLLRSGCRRVGKTVATARVDARFIGSAISVWEAVGPGDGDCSTRLRKTTSMACRSYEKNAGFLGPILRHDGWSPLARNV